MAGIQRQDASVVIQPSGVVQTANLGLDSAMAAQGWNQLSSSLMTGFDMIKQQADRDDVLRAAQDAPAMITRDGNGLVVPPKSFDAPGGFFQSKAYKDAYKNTLFNHYSVMAEQDFSNYANNVIAQHPTDPDAARAKLAERRAAMVQELDPNYAPLITLKLNAMSGQVESKISANVQLEQNKVTAERAEYAYEGVVQQAGQLAQLPAKFDAETLTINNAQLGADFKRATELMRTAGFSEAYIEKKWDDARIKALTFKDEMTIRSSHMTAQNYSSEAYTDWLLGLRDMIDSRAKTLGPDGPAYLARMQGALSWAMGTNQLRVQQADDRDRVRAQRQVLGILGSVNAQEGVDGGVALDALNRLRNDTYFNPSMTEAQKIRQIGMIDQATGRVRTDLTETLSGRVTQLYTAATSVETAPERSRGMVQELRQIVNDPMIRSWAPAGVMNYAERAISSIASNIVKTDMATFAGHAKSGLIEPERIVQYGKDAAAKGWIGTEANSSMNPTEWAQLEQEGMRAYQQRKMLYGEAAKVVADAAKGIAPTAIGRKVIDQVPELAFRTSDGKPYDAKSETHRFDSSAHYNTTLAVPEPVKQAMANVPMGTDPETTKALAEQLNSFKAIAMSKGKTEAQAIGALNEELGGKIVPFLSLAQRYGHDAAVKAMLSDTTSESRNLGKNPASASEDLMGTVDRLVGSLGTQAEPGFIARMAGLSPQQEWTRNQLGKDAPTLGGYFINNLSPVGFVRGREHSGSFLSITPTDDIRREITAAAFSISSHSGQLIDKAHPSVNFNEVAVMQAMDRLRDRMEIVPDPNDSNKGILQWKSAHSKVGEMLKLDGPATQEQLRGYALGLYDTMEKLRRENGMPPTNLGGDIDRKNVFMTQEISQDGSASWVMWGQYKGGYGVTEMMRLPESSPMFSEFAKDIVQQASTDMRAHWQGRTVGPDGASEAYAGGAMMAFALGGIGLPTLDAGIKRQEITKDRLTKMGYTPDDRSVREKIYDFVMGNDPNDPSRWPSPNIDISRTRKAFKETKDLGLEQRAQNLEYLNRLNSRVPVMPK